MQYLNDDMDDLMRIAAEEYPLNIDADNWEKMRALLLPNETKSNKSEEDKSWLSQWRKFFCGLCNV